MVQSSKTFRIFVSSTFSDLKEERNILQKYAFPKLRELCAQHGFKFQAIDLRWGVSEEAGLDQQTMKICLEEIERSQRVSPKPNFIVLLGNRYGWQPLPAEIEANEFNHILEKVSADEEELLLWKEEQPEDKKGWYRLDENAVPAVYCLQPRTGEYVNYDNWTQVEQKMHSILLEAASKLNLSKDDFLKYYASATEQEIVRGALKVEDAQDHVFCFFRNIENLPDNKNFVDLDSKGNIDNDAQEKLENLKQKLREQLPESRIKEYDAKWTDEGVSNDHLKQLCKDVYEKLEGIILEKIEEIEDKKPLDHEIEAHKEFGNDRAKFFTGRTEILNDISEYLKNGTNSPLAVYGESGSGKSALMAKAVLDAKENYHEAKIITRFIGATPDSSDIRSLLESLCQQINKTYGKSESEVPSDYNDLVNEFPERLKSATEEKPLFIFLDALDQLSNSNKAHSLNWLPDNIPNDVYIIVSSLEENFYDTLKNKIPEENLLKLDELKKEEGEDLLRLWLKEGTRTLQSEQWSEVIKEFQIEGLPLYLKLAFEEAKNWKSYTKTPELEPDIPGIIRQMFNRLSDDSNHGELIVDRSLGYLAASKNGLSEDEIIDVLSRDKEVFYEFIYRARSEPTEILKAVQEVLTEDESELKEDSWKRFEKLQRNKDFCFDVFDRMSESKISFKLPVAIWSRLYFDLEPYLTERSADGTSLLAFYHRQLGEVVSEEFLKEDVKIEKHRALAKYFLSQDLEIKRDNKRIYNVRKVSELPYQQSYGKMQSELEKTLTNFRFIEVKCHTGLIYDLIEDYTYYLSKSFNLIKNALQLSSYVIVSDIDQLPGQLMGRLLDQNDSLIKDLLKDIKINVRKKWLCPNYASLNPVDSNINSIWKAYNDSPKCKLLVSDNEEILAVISYKGIDYWDVKTGECVNPMLGENNFSKEELNNLSGIPNEKVNDMLFDGGLKGSKWINSTKRKNIKVECELSYQTNPLRTNPTCKSKLSVFNEDSETILDTNSTGFNFRSALISAAISTDNKYVLAGGLNGEIKLWKVDGEEIAVNLSYSDSIEAISFFPKSHKGAFLSRSGNIGIFNLELENENLKSKIADGKPLFIYANNIGDFALVGFNDGNILKINALNGQILKKYGSFELWTSINYKVTSDLKYVFRKGVGPDYYDGWIIEIYDINTDRQIFSYETTGKYMPWEELEYLKEENVHFIFGIERNNLIKEGGKKHLINLLTRSDTEKLPNSDSISIPWLKPQRYSSNGIYYKIMDGNTINVILPNNENLLFTSDDVISDVAISFDGSCVALACSSGQIHCLSILGPYGKEADFPESHQQSEYYNVLTEDEELIKIVTDNQKSSDNSFKAKTDYIKENIFFTEHLTPISKIEFQESENRWFSPDNEIKTVHNEYAVTCKRCGLFDQNPGRPPENCPNCGWNGKDRKIKKKSRWKFWK